MEFKGMKHWAIAGVLTVALAACSENGDTPRVGDPAEENLESVTDEVAATVDCTRNPVQVTEAWVRVNPVPNRPAAGYMTLIAADGCADRLTAAASADAGRVELHNHEMTDGIMRMVKVDGIDVPPGQTVELQPGGLHLMLFDITVTPEDADSIPLVLTFEKAGAVNATAVLETLSSVPVPEKSRSDKDGDHGNN